MSTVGSTTSSTSSATTSSTTATSATTDPSTVDWSELISEMFAARTAQADSYETEITDNEAKIASYQQMQTLLSGLETAAEVLADPAIGGFGTRVLLDEPGHVLLEEIDGFFADRHAEDVLVLDIAAKNEMVQRVCKTKADVRRLWETCQIPDYRKISSQNHSELVATLYKFLMGPDERIPADWFAQQVALADRTDGDIDTLANRIAHIRTWTFVSNRAEWLADPDHWRERTRAIEDSLSDALHEQLTQRFVDRRTSALMRGLKDKDQLNA